MASTSTSSGFNSLAADPPSSIPVDSDLVLILAALLCALICCVGLFSAARCACLRRAATVSTSHSMPLQVPSDKPLRKKVLQSLPKSTFNNTTCSASSNTDCAICLMEFVQGDELRILPQCGHGFHVGCIDMWLHSHSSCPSCRQNLDVSRCKKCGDIPANSTGGDVDLEIGGFKAATATATATATTNHDDNNRFLA